LILGDASVAHPFASLLVALRTMARTFELPADDPVLERFQDAYLESWRLGRDHGRFKIVLRPALAVPGWCDVPLCRDLVSVLGS
jgi:hypothetical protein